MRLRPSVFRIDGSGNLWQYKGTGEGEFNPAGAVQIGNGRPNLLGREPDGDLFLYTSDGAGGWENGGVGIKIGNGWNTFNAVF